MPRFTCSALVLAALGLLAAGCNDSERDTAEESARRTATTLASGAEAATRLNATLTGASEAPTTGDPDATGTASVNLDASKGEVCYEVSAQKIDRPVGMHIHEAAAGQSGPVVVALSTPTATDTITKGCVNAEATLIARIVARPSYYVNLHTDRYPQGAVRGQLSQ
ncbi:MAG: CHRD domain-containing protein [Actinomycetota bacterium]|nr:CHRD domain-containing protein [Actinomycetota bacterium]MDQ3575855.1 CHRD domain-containing protein [Actinomycetota bacterium]